MRIERYGTNADNSVPRDVKSPLQAGQREMMDTDERRLIESTPIGDERAGEDAKDRNEPIVPEGSLEARGKTEIELSREERNPYLQGVAAPTTAYVCPFCHELTAREGLPGPGMLPPHTHAFVLEG